MAQPEQVKKRSNKREKSASLKNLYGQIQESKFHKYIAHDFAGYERYLKNGGVKLYSDQEISELKAANISDRLPPRATAYYMDLASRSAAIENLIKARPEEMEDLSGEKDPSNQLKYSPVPGLLHKYELVLLYVVRTCSSWCRYCYRSDFLTSKTDKDIGTMSQIADYIAAHNEKVKKGKTIAEVDKDFVRAMNEDFPIREALLSGGDPMVLSNKNLFTYLNGLAEAGIRTIRIGTKELAFFPMRFDDNFFQMLDLFHELHPNVNIAFMTHFTHADELLQRGEDGEYKLTNGYHYTRIPQVEKSVRNLRGRYYVTLENQTPIIDSVNDSSEALRRLQIELKRLGINNHYFFQCREIEGHKCFAVPVEKAWKIHSDSQRGLSGIEKSRFAMSTEFGKLEVISVVEAMDFDKLGLEIPEAAKKLTESLFGQGLVVLKAHRTADSHAQGGIIIARRNPEALWITGYEDRIIYDGRKVGDERFSALGKILSGLFGGIDDELIENIAGSL